MRKMISARQMMCLQIMSLPIVGHFLLDSIMIQLGGKDAWISVLFTMPLGLLFVSIIYRIFKLHDGADLQTVILRVFGGKLGKLFLALFICNGLIIIVITLYGMIDFARLIFLVERSDLTVFSVTYSTIGFGIISGIEAVARVCEPLSILVPLSGLTAGIATLPFKDFTRILPFFEHGWGPAFKPIGLVFALYAEMMVFMMLPIHLNKKKPREILYRLWGVIFFLTIIFTSGILSCIAIFGVESATAKLYPMYEILKLVNFGFINRFDVYGIFLVVIGGSIRLMIWHITVSQALSKLWTTSNTWWTHILIVGFVGYYVLKMIPNYIYFELIWLKQYYPMTGAVSLFLVLLTWLVSEWKAKFSAKTNQFPTAGAHQTNEKEANPLR